MDKNMSNEKSHLYDPASLKGLFQDSQGKVPVTELGQKVGRWTSERLSNEDILTHLDQKHRQNGDR